MTTDQIFNPSRFGAFIVKFVTENRNRLLIIAGLVILLPLLYTTAIPYFNKSYKLPIIAVQEIRQNLDPMWSYELPGFIFMLTAFSAYICSLFYAPLANKTTRLGLLMSPASQFEKFCAFLAIYAVGGLLLFFLSTIFADWVRVLVYAGTAARHGVYCAMIPPEYLLSFGEVIPGVSDIEEQAVSTTTTMHLGVTALFLSTFFTQALYALGSSVWPKSSFVKTTCFTIVFWMAFTMLLGWGMNIFFTHGFMTRTWWGSDPDTLLTLIDVVLAVVTVVLWTVGYFRFKEWEIIKRW